jgi:type IV pilus assembly protein PilE
MITVKTRGHWPATGFTLIELMIAVAIVGVLAMVATPSFLDSIRKGRRAEAFAAISAIQQAQERWRSNNASYATSLSQLGIASTTASGNYQVATAGSSSSYTVTANGTTGSSQANDRCRKLSVKALAGSMKYAGCSACADADLSYGETDPCWSR